MSVTVLKFTAAWCQPCQQMTTLLKKVAPAYPSVVFEEIDVTKNVDLATQHGVSTLPTLVCNGHRTAGALSEAALRAWLNAVTEG